MMKGTFRHELNETLDTDMIIAELIQCKHVRSAANQALGSILIEY